jgi:hypothetical protein
MLPGLCNVGLNPKVHHYIEMHEKLLNRNFNNHRTPVSNAMNLSSKQARNPTSHHNAALVGSSARASVVQSPVGFNSNIKPLQKRPGNINNSLRSAALEPPLNLTMRR